MKKARQITEVSNVGLQNALEHVMSGKDDPEGLVGYLINGLNTKVYSDEPIVDGKDVANLCKYLRDKKPKIDKVTASRDINNHITSFEIEFKKGFHFKL